MSTVPLSPTSSGLAISSHKTGTVTLQSGSDNNFFGIRTYLTVLFSIIFVYALSEAPVILHAFRPEASRTVSEANTYVRSHKHSLCLDDDCERKVVEEYDEAARQKIIISSNSEYSKCTCEGDSNSDRCNCSEDCTFIEQVSLCAELVGNCECGRDEDAMLCECWGFCLHVEDRKRSCHKEWGCSWNGVSCDVQEFDQFITRGKDYKGEEKDKQ